MYTFDKLTSLMHQTAVKSMAEMPAAIDRIEKDIRTFNDRTGETFPEMFKMPILLQLIPPAYKREIEASFRISGADKSYETLSRHLVDQGNEARYRGGKGSSLGQPID